MKLHLRNSFFALLAVLAASAVPIAAWAQAGPPQDRYIVVLNEGAGFADDVAADIALRTNGRVGYVYENALQGFSITMPRAALRGVARDPRIAYVEEDIPVTIFAEITPQVTPFGVQRIFANLAALDIDGTDDNRVDVDVAVLDTGIDRQHPDLNVVGGANCMNTTGGGPPWARSYFCDETADGDDDHYHGTHVAGTIGALDNGIGVVGVAPGARLWAVKVLDAQGSGSLAGIIAGIDWVAAQGKIEVINMSLGGSGTSTAMNDAVANAVSSGVTVVVAAGNEDDDAANHTPANAPDAITVSALADFDGLSGGDGLPTCRTDQDDTLADFSNWGTTVDIAAPGVCILSTYPIEQGGYGTISGTSMASPHVAGAAALLASNGDDPASILATLLGMDNSGWTDDSGDGIQEPLLVISGFAFVPILAPTGGGGTNDPPTASFIHGDCIAGQSCSFDGSGSGDTAGGSISTYAWNFGDGTNATGATVVYAFPSSETAVSYDVTLTVTDNESASDAVTESVLVAGFAPGDGNSNDIYVSAIDMSDRDYGPGGSFHDLTTTVTIKRDSDADGVSEDSDVAASGAVVTIKVTLLGGAVFSGTVQTDGTGQGSYILKRVSVGGYVSDVTAVTHATYQWNQNLDAEYDKTHQVN